MSHINDEEENFLKIAVKNYFGDSNVSPTEQIDYQLPFIQTTRQDARGDTISLAFESMIHRKFPLWAAYQLAYEFADLFADRLGTGKVPFTEDYWPFNGNITTWYHAVIDCFDQFMGELIQGRRKLPVMPEQWTKLPVSYCAKQNRRPKMEDRLIVLPSLAVIEPSVDLAEKQTDSFFAVFDGHNGAECATYANAHFFECLLEVLLSQRAEKDMEKVLEKTFNQVNKRLAVRCLNEVNGRCHSFLAGFFGQWAGGGGELIIQRITAGYEKLRNFRTRNLKTIFSNFS